MTELCTCNTALPCRRHAPSTTVEQTKYVVRIGGKCEKLDCRCNEFDGVERVGVGKAPPPFHEGCDCYLTFRQGGNMNEHKSKARLIVKRIVTHIAADSSITLANVWKELSDETRISHVEEWTEIAAAVLGEKEEPIPPEATLEKLCASLGYDEVLCRVKNIWQRAAPESAWSLGPPSMLLTGCGCDGDIECGWCEGTDKVTTRVKQAKEEANQQPEGPVEKTSEGFGDPDTWQKYLWHAGWMEGFVRNMRGLGAVKVEVPASRNGSFSVEFGSALPQDEVRIPPMSEEEKKEVLEIIRTMKSAGIEDIQEVEPTPDPLAKIKQQVIAQRTDADDSKEEQPTLCAPCWSCKGPVCFRGSNTEKCPKCGEYNAFSSSRVTNPDPE